MYLTDAGSLFHERNIHCFRRDLQLLQLPVATKHYSYRYIISYFPAILKLLPNFTKGKDPLKIQLSDITKYCHPRQWGQCRLTIWVKEKLVGRKLLVMEHNMSLVLVPWRWLSRYLARFPWRHVYFLASLL